MYSATIISLANFINELHTLSLEAPNKHLGLRGQLEVQVVFVSGGKVEQHHLIQIDYLARQISAPDNLLE